MLVKAESVYGWSNRGCIDSTTHTGIAQGSYIRDTILIFSWVRNQFEGIRRCLNLHDSKKNMAIRNYIGRSLELRTRRPMVVISRLGLSVSHGKCDCTTQCLTSTYTLLVGACFVNLRSRVLRDDTSDVCSASHRWKKQYCTNLISPTEE